ncbi:unnamed protein product [Caenorhabditis auriculariae]|uniref:C-mannosyltransferase dpy-19 n=1 Tax=Caenorhabditis auriculariae TaxID=2777116 RepID=A0A8S1GYH1_9PELO|nr:unnamed protein product [Caenorhabditis auriculariae]
MAYRTEMGLYYSYYKTIITAPSFAEGLLQITRDNVTEYGHEINTLKRFNLYPEVILGFLYRQFRWYATAVNWQVEYCWNVNRGESLPPVQSCEGIGNPHYFYVYTVFVIASTVASSIFFLGVLLSDSILGGLIAVASFAFNHGEATRVQWTPPLRESFAFPFIIGHIALLTFVIKSRKVCCGWIAALVSLSLPATLFWQFSQFAFFTQICSVVVVFALDLLPSPTAKTVVFSHLISFVLSFVLLFGNEMLLTTFLLPSIISLMVLVAARPLTDKIQLRPLHVAVSGLGFLLLTVSLKIVLSRTLQIEDDAHILDILRSKFTDYQNFHTRLYTCSAEFDFISLETLKKLTQTFLIPTACTAVVLLASNLLKLHKGHLLWRNDSVSHGGEVVYNAVQLFCYTVMAVLIMRLKLFFTPHLCVFGALLANHTYVGNSLPWRIPKTIHAGIVVAFVAMLASRGIVNIRQQLFIRGEYSNPEQEMLFNWIQQNTAKDAVFGGTMPVMANVKLSTLRPIVNHPHYEDVGIRERTLKVYSMFSRKPIKQVYKTLKAMGIDYFIFQVMNCGEDKRRPQCVYRGMWDEADPANRDRTALCDLLIQAANTRDDAALAPFRMVYNPNRNYIVLKL